ATRSGSKLGRKQESAGYLSHPYARSRKRRSCRGRFGIYLCPVKAPLRTSVSAPKSNGDTSRNFSVLRLRDFEVWPRMLAQAQPGSDREFRLGSRIADSMAIVIRK